MNEKVSFGPYYLYINAGDSLDDVIESIMSDTIQREVAHNLKCLSREVDFKDEDVIEAEVESFVEQRMTVSMLATAVVTFRAVKDILEWANTMDEEDQIEEVKKNKLFIELLFDPSDLVQLTHNFVHKL